MKAELLVFPSKKQRFHRRVKRFFSNYKIKDRLFCYIFEKDHKALLQLYNVLNGTNYEDEHALRIVTLKNVVYMSMNNDVAFVLAETMNLYEHQSTYCPNMPLRFLLYLAAEYEVLVEGMDVNLYGSALIKLPAPQCIVFYNGNEAIPEEQLLHLTDAFTDADGNRQESCIELTVKVLNINDGYNKKLMEGCRRLEEYSLFVAKVRELQQKGYSTERSVDIAVTYCIRQGIMSDILRPFHAEVKKMLLTEYDEKKTIRLFRKEAKEEGRKEGIKEGQRDLIKVMIQNGVSAEQISEMTNLPRHEVEGIRVGVEKSAKRKSETP